MWFAFLRIDSSATLTEEWVDYINPLNQLGLFFLGIVMGYYLKDKNFRPTVTISALIIGLGLFIFYPTIGDAVVLVTDYNRIAFTVASTLVTFAFFKMNVDFGNTGAAFKKLGEISYSLYLLHPLVWIGLTKVVDLDSLTQVLVCMPLSLLLSVIVYVRFEKPFIHVGNTICHWILNKDPKL